MFYLGGKGRLGRSIAEAVLAHTAKRGTYLEPFLGGGNSFRHLAPHFAATRAGDAHEDLMLMWEAARGGWEPPPLISEEDYRRLRREPPSALRAAAGFGCSFGGKWWGGYARSAKCDPDYYARHTAKSVREVAQLMGSTELRRASFAEWSVDEDHVVYADPPYVKTTGYRGGFDHPAFWATMTAWSEAGADVFVSEYAAPPDWTCVWSREHVVKVSGGTGATSCERLFVHASWST
jgi:DNA adenine methylase